MMKARSNAQKLAIRLWVGSIFSVIDKLGKLVFRVEVDIHEVREQEDHHDENDEYADGSSPSDMDHQEHHQICQ